MEVQHVLISYILCLLVSTSTAQDKIAFNLTGVLEYRNLSGDIGRFSQLDFYSDPKIHDMIHPKVGPLAGGTKLTLTGTDLNTGLRAADYRVKLGGTECPVTSINATAIICKTQQAGNDKRDVPLNITVVVGTQTYKLTQVFTYRSNPSVTKIEPTESILSGGNLVTVTGVGLDVVGEPRLRVTLLYSGNSVRILEEICEVTSSTTLQCPVPEFPNVFGPDGELDLNALYGSTTPSTQRTASDRRRRSIDSPYRHRRDTSGTVNTDRVRFEVGVLLDGLNRYQTFSNMTVFKNPQLYRWTDVQVVTTSSRQLQVKGVNLLRGLQPTDYVMLVGQSECGSLTAYDNLLLCTAPRDTPTPHRDNTDTTGLLQVRVHFGLNKEGVAGKLRYKTGFFDDPATRWGIIGAGAVLVVLLLVVVTVCVCKRRGH